MLKDMLGNRLQEGDRVVTKVTETVVGVIKKISGEGRILGDNNHTGMGKIFIEVSCIRVFDPNNPVTDLIKVAEPEKDKSIN